ncbi:GNAT family N-acetyltransferase [Microbacterium invictum]|uniref:Ribosomal protein S18 acetylase RimI-like enzyme n=1 Tax=Microbacterium invictum TaxID=515415 RepID=A0AA40SMZ7_9MICO|nr:MULTISPECIES: GNAT family N-acetyltransferase [Microbacterium]MBB4139192.1 ribosomal protein S18 acetylase RimI-like enzyme [Microbacterium invictum]
MSDDVEVRRLAEAEIERIEADEPPGQGFVRAMWEQQQSGYSVLLVAWEGDRCVGSGQLVSTSHAELKNLNVVATHRGLGVGSALIAAAEARVAGGGQLAVGVAEDNPRARALYERLGYVGTGELSTVTYEYVDADGVRRTATEVDETLVKVIRRP